MRPLVLKGVEPRAQKAWTNTEHQTLIELWETGLSDQDIGETLGRSAKSVADRRQKTKTGEHEMERIQGTEARARKSWTGKEINTLLELAHEGMSHVDIGKEINRSDKAVYLKLSRMKAALKDEKPKPTITRKQLAKELEPGLNALFGTEYEPKPLLPTVVHDDSIHVPRKLVYCAVIVVVATISWAAGFYG